MKRKICLVAALFVLMFVQAKPAAAQQRLIVRSTSLPLLQKACLLNTCQILGNLDGSVNQLFLLTFPNGLPLNLITGILRLVPGVLDVEVDVVRQIPGAPPFSGNIPNGLNQRTLVNYFGTPVWMGYAQQPASQIILLNQGQTTYKVSGRGIVADIDTGVDFSHPALQGVLLQGYDFTRNQPGGNVMLDVQTSSTSNCSTCTSAGLDQSTAAVLDKQSSAAVLDQSTAAVLDSPQYADFGHGTMVLGVVHLVAPDAMLMPLKSFGSDGTGYTSNIIRAIYYAVQNKANVINMSFDLTAADSELAQAISYAQANNVTCVASAGNDGKAEVVYPASLAGVMGVASTNDLNQQSTFSNYGTQVVFVAAPGENIITTYPYDTYASSSGTSFSAPFVSGTVALLLDMDHSLTPTTAAAAIGHATTTTKNMGHGVLNVYLALGYLQVTIGH
ncbi:MAG TPA: S8 family serine peptidase [Candidatus Acidoferrales bacterium]|jgi:subtilisin family serine protease|nr:S8 family serine peptidase [Candidatus Acidoferrales bacterium]